LPKTAFSVNNIDCRCVLQFGKAVMDSLDNPDLLIRGKGIIKII